MKTDDNPTSVSRVANDEFVGDIGTLIANYVLRYGRPSGRSTARISRIDRLLGIPSGMAARLMFASGHAGIAFLYLFVIPLLTPWPVAQVELTGFAVLSIAIAARCIDLSISMQES